MSTDLFADFMRGYNWAEGLQDRKREREWLEMARDQQMRDWEYTAQKRRDADELKQWEELSRRYETYALKPDGSEKSVEELRADGSGEKLLEIYNSPLFAPVRNVNGKDVRITGMYGRGSKYMLEAEWRNPETGEVESRSGLTEGRTNRRDDPVRVLDLGETRKQIVDTLRAKNAAFHERYGNIDALRGRDAAERNVLDAMGVPGGRGEGGAPGGAPSAAPNAKAFVATNYPLALKAAGGNEEQAIAMLSQSALETGWGRSAPGNNMFGIKANKGGGGPRLATTEVGPDGRAYSTRASFRQYGSAEESFADRQRFLAENPRYAKAGYDPNAPADQQFAALQRAGYATDPQYAQKLSAISQQIRSMVGSAAKPSLADAALPAPRMYPDPQSPRGYAPAAQAAPQAAPQVAPQAAPSGAPPIDAFSFKNDGGTQQAVRTYAELLARRIRSPDNPNITKALEEAGSNLRYYGVDPKMVESAPLNESINNPGRVLEHAMSMRQAPGAKDEAMAVRGLAPPAATGTAPIDKSRPIINNPDGSFSTERTITIEVDGKHLVLPTIVDGKQLSPEQAIQAMREGKNAPVGVFNTAQEAEAAAQQRSQQIGVERGAEAQAPGAAPTSYTTRPKSQLTEDQARRQREALLEYRKYDKSMTLEKIAEIMRTGRLDGQELKFVQDYAGGINVLDAKTGERIMHHENPAVAQMRKQGKGKGGGGGSEDNKEYVKDGLETLSKSFRPHWAKGEDHKHDPDLVRADILNTMRVNRDALRQLGIPDDYHKWEPRHFDAFASWYTKARSGDRVIEGWVSDQKIDTRGTLTPQGELRDAGPRGRWYYTPDNPLPIDLQMLVDQGYAASIEEAAALVEKQLGGH